LDDQEEIFIGSNWTAILNWIKKDNLN
jgi:hypothetical protein